MQIKADERDVELMRHGGHLQIVKKVLQRIIDEKGRDDSDDDNMVEISKNCATFLLDIVDDSTNIWTYLDFLIFLVEHGEEYDRIRKIPRPKEIYSVMAAIVEAIMRYLAIVSLQLKAEDEHD